MRDKKKTIIGISLIALSIALFVFLQFFGMYPKVLALSKDYDRGQEIKMEDVIKVKVLKKSQGQITDISMLKDKASLQKMKKGEPIYLDYLQDKDMLTAQGGDKYIFSMPEDWLVSYPQSLRRGDTAYIYSEGTLITQAKVAYVKDRDNLEVTSTDKDRLGATGLVSGIELIVDNDQAETLSLIGEGGGTFVILYK